MFDRTSGFGILGGRVVRSGAAIFQFWVCSFLSLGLDVLRELKGFSIKVRGLTGSSGTKAKSLGVHPKTC